MSKALIVALLFWFAPVDGPSAYRAFQNWQQQPESRKLEWQAAMDEYAAKLKLEGLAPGDVAQTMAVYRDS